MNAVVLNLVVNGRAYTFEVNCRQSAMRIDSNASVAAADQVREALDEVYEDAKAQLASIVNRGGGRRTA